MRKTSELRRIRKNRDLMFIIIIITCLIISAPIVAAQTKVFDSSIKNIENKELSKKDSKGKVVEIVKNVDKSDEEKKLNENKSKGNKDKTMQQPNFVKVNGDYFDRALFIGDSRTVGLYEYGGLNNATFFANSGMSVYNVVEEKVSVKNNGKIGLEELLINNNYEKVYVMLGINELGYNMDSTLKKYDELVQKIRKMQPNALIFLEGNMHVTEKRNENDNIFNNKNINKLNKRIQLMSDSKKIFYIDINKEFDDKNGNLSAEYSSDNTHLLGKYYLKWADWLATVGVK